MSYRNVLWLSLSSILAVGIAGPRPALGEDPAPARAQDQTQAGTQPQSGARPSLGEIARKARAERAENSGKPAKVYTNENLPAGPGGLTMVKPPAEAAAPGGAAEAKHGPAYFASRMAELQRNLDTHERELAVLQQKLGQNNVQFYRDPSKQLQQQYSRSDIDKLSAAIEEKKQQVEADKQAISDLQQEVQAAGGSSEWLSGGSAAPKPDLSGVEKGSQKYWQLRFEAARKAVEQADRGEKLSEDELDLVKAQQAHDMGTAAAPGTAQQVAAKEAQAESDRAAAEKAHQELDALQQEFDQSGAPAEWSQPEPPQ